MGDEFDRDVMSTEERPILYFDVNELLNHVLDGFRGVGIVRMDYLPIAPFTIRVASIVGIFLDLM